MLNKIIAELEHYITSLLLTTTTTKEFVENVVGISKKTDHANIKITSVGSTDYANSDDFVVIQQQLTATQLQLLYFFQKILGLLQESKRQNDISLVQTAINLLKPIPLIKESTQPIKKNNLSNLLFWSKKPSNKDNVITLGQFIQRTAINKNEANEKSANPVIDFPCEIKTPLDNHEKENVIKLYFLLEAYLKHVHWFYNYNKDDATNENIFSQDVKTWEDSMEELAPTPSTFDFVRDVVFNPGENEINAKFDLIAPKKIVLIPTKNNEENNDETNITSEQTNSSLNNPLNVINEVSNSISEEKPIVYDEQTRLYELNIDALVDKTPYDTKEKALFKTWLFHNSGQINATIYMSLLKYFVDQNKEPYGDLYKVKKTIEWSIEDKKIHCFLQLKAHGLTRINEHCQHINMVRTKKGIEMLNSFADLTQEQRLSHLNRHKEELLPVVNITMNYDLTINNNGIVKPCVEELNVDVFISELSLNKFENKNKNEFNNDKNANDEITNAPEQVRKLSM